jgi:hypothetical protein
MGVDYGYRSQAYILEMLATKREHGNDGKALLYESNVFSIPLDGRRFMHSVIGRFRILAIQCKLVNFHKYDPA